MSESGINPTSVWSVRTTGWLILSYAVFAIAFFLSPMLLAISFGAVFAVTMADRCRQTVRDRQQVFVGRNDASAKTPVWSWFESFLILGSFFCMAVLVTSTNMATQITCIFLAAWSTWSVQVTVTDNHRRSIGDRDIDSVHWFPQGMAL